MDYPFERNATEYTMSYDNTSAEFDIESKAEIEGLHHLHSHECNIFCQLRLFQLNSPHNSSLSSTTYSISISFLSISVYTFCCVLYQFFFWQTMENENVARLKPGIGKYNRKLQKSRDRGGLAPATLCLIFILRCSTLPTPHSSCFSYRRGHSECAREAPPNYGTAALSRDFIPAPRALVSLKFYRISFVVKNSAIWGLFGELLLEWATCSSCLWTSCEVSWMNWSPTWKGSIWTRRHCEPRQDNHLQNHRLVVSYRWQNGCLWMDCSLCTNSVEVHLADGSCLRSSTIVGVASNWKCGINVGHLYIWWKIHSIAWVLPRWFTFEQPSASGSFVDPLTASAVPTQRESSRPSFTARLASLSSFSFPTARSQRWFSNLKSTYTFSCRQELNSRDKDYYENVPECMSACCRCCTAPCREVGKILSTLFNWLTCNRQSNDEDDQTPPPISRYWKWLDFIIRRKKRVDT